MDGRRCSVNCSLRELKNRRHKMGKHGDDVHKPVTVGATVVYRRVQTLWCVQSYMTDTCAQIKIRHDSLGVILMAAKTRYLEEVRL